MANILLVANLNVDHTLLLDGPLQQGARLHYQDQGMRLGGGAANTGVALNMAGHNVAIVSQIGNDKASDYLLDQALQAGLDCQRVNRHPLHCTELQLLIEPDGERTILKPRQPAFKLPSAPDWHDWQVLYINSVAEGVVEWAESAMEASKVIAQYSSELSYCPCHVLLASKDDLPICEDKTLDIWQLGQQFSGSQLQYFIVTDAEHGAKLYDGKSMQQLPASNTTVIDSTGAGDAYAAGIIDSLCYGLEITAAMQEAAVWGAAAVATAGSVPAEALQQYLKCRDNI